MHTIDTQYLPSWELHPEEIESNLLSILAENRRVLSCALTHPPSWTLIDTLNDRAEILHRYWAVVRHLHAVSDTPELRAAYHRCVPIVSHYETEWSHHTGLYDAICALHRSPQYVDYTPIQQKIITQYIQDFHLSGIHLNSEQKSQYAQLLSELEQLFAEFEEHVLDASMHWKTQIVDETLLSGIPASIVQQAKHLAEQDQKSGWIFTLDEPIYRALMMHADSRSLRETCYRAYVTRASDLSEHTQWDNTHIIHKILSHRLQLAHLLGFPHAAAHVLATKMIKTPQQVLDFLNQLSQFVCAQAKKEHQELQNFAKNILHIDTVCAWDQAYVEEKMRQQLLGCTQESLRTYFSKSVVMQGLFAIVRRLFDIDMRLVPNAPRWHSDVECYALYDPSHQLIGFCYFDVYARPNKRSGAWMDDCQVRYRSIDGLIFLPIALVTTNFAPPIADSPALWIHDDVVTLFHELGHALQHMLTTMDEACISGIRGIPWDAVELASQFLEHWAWEKDGLAHCAIHHITQESLSDADIRKLQQSRIFHASLSITQQLEYALFDFIVHMEFDSQQIGQIERILSTVRQNVSVASVPDFNRFYSSFLHIFCGGYEAAYYSYLWSAVMACDAFSLFLERGVFDKKTAQIFLEHILSSGGSESMEVLFRRYRGRDPEITAFLQHHGINAHSQDTKNICCERF